MQSYGSYPYYGQTGYQQNPYPPSGPNNGYPPFNYSHNPAAFRPETRENPIIPHLPQPSIPRKKGHARTATMPTASGPYHRKSAIKKPAVAEDSQPANSALPTLTRSRTYSIPSNLIPDTDPAFRPHHMFLIFIGKNELRLENIMKPAMDELRQTILPMWPGGIESDSQHGHDWTVKFRDSPWAMDRHSAALTWKIIVELFTLFARRGFTFQTCTNTGNPPPRLIFEVTSQDYTSEFFLAYFSRGGRRLTLINPPAHIDISIGAQLKAVLPRRIRTDEVVQDNLRVVEVIKRNSLGGTEVEPAVFLMHVLKIISALGFDLVTAVPLGRRGLFGIRPGRELLVFKGSAAG